MDAGLLPNLARLRDRGSFLPLRSTNPPATYPAWTSCVTGVNPGRHGIFDFTETRPGAYELRFVNATFRKVPALWNVLSEAGKRVCILGVPGTYPPEPVNGIMVAGFDSPVCTRVDASFVYPRELYHRVRNWRFADFQESHIGAGWHAYALRRLLEGIESKEAIACDLVQREPWDFAMIVFGESDTVAHHFWMFHDPLAPRHRPGFETAVQQVYQRLDRAVGSLIDAFGPATVLVVSDHGFGGAGTGVFHINNWLAEHGYLRFAKQPANLLKNLALRCAPSRWQGLLFRRFRAAATRLESNARFGGIDWAATRAWSEELNYFPSIRVNLKSREPTGQVEQACYDAFCDMLCQDLEASEYIHKAWRRGDLYHGDYVTNAPDIVLELELENGYSHTCLRSRGGPAFRRITPAEHVGGKEHGMNGTHRPDGTLILSEPVTCSRPNIAAIAPTVLAELGVPGLPMDEASLLSPGRDTVPGSAQPPESDYTPAEAREIEKRLRDLGYWE